MAVEFQLPDVGEGIDGAELLEWKVQVGDTVREDQALVEVETDKAITVIPSPSDGVIREIRFQPGDRVAVGAVLVVIDADADGSGPNGAPSRPLASPAIRKLARELVVDLRDVAGSGPGGRIQREDLAALGTETRASAAGDPPRIVPLRGVRRTIAERMTTAWQTIPHIVDYRELDATRLLEARDALRAAAPDESTARSFTLTPLVVKASCVAMAEHPYGNASIDPDRAEITLHSSCHVGVATSAPDGLMVPVVRDAERKSLAELAREVSALTAAARERRLTAPQLTGATFTVNNFGSLGVWLGTPIINPPEVVNIGIGRVEERPVARDGQVVIRRVMPLSVSGDHRVLDGDTLAALVSRLVDLLEQPALMLADAR